MKPRAFAIYHLIMATELSGTSSRSLLLLVCMMVAVANAPRSFADAIDEYRVDYEVVPLSGSEYSVTMRVGQSEPLLRKVRISSLPSQIQAFDLHPGLQRDGRSLTWSVPPTGGTLRWVVDLAGRDDATVHHSDKWAVFRLEDLVPAMATTSRSGSRSRTRLRFVDTSKRSYVSPYRPVDGWWEIDNPARRFDRPTGWIIAGSLSVRRDEISGTRVAIASPRGVGARQMDALAFATWHLPYYRKLFPKFPDRLLVVMAGDPMFRGGLSAPNSLFMHIDRPLISANATSTLLHELFHVGLGGRAGPGDDWIVEGLAEFYSHELLHRAGSVTERRHEKALAWFEEYGASVTSLKTSVSRGPTTWRAVTVFDALNREIVDRTDAKQSLDDVVRTLTLDDSPLTLKRLRTAARSVIGESSTTLSDKELPL